MGICGEWQLWTHFSFCQVVDRLSGVSLLYWPLAVNSLENICFSLFLLKERESSQLPNLPLKHKHKTNLFLGKLRRKTEEGVLQMFSTSQFNSDVRL
jgi:hypothetical protein